MGFLEKSNDSTFPSKSLFSRWAVQILIIRRFLCQMSSLHFEHGGRYLQTTTGYSIESATPTARNIEITQNNEIAYL